MNNDDHPLAETKDRKDFDKVFSQSFKMISGIPNQIRDWY